MRVAKNSKSKIPVAGKVLIATQDSRVSGLIREFLLETGYDAICELNLDAALETLIGTHVDLLIIDGEMPEKVLEEFCGGSCPDKARLADDCSRNV